MLNYSLIKQKLFNLGQIVATPGAIERITPQWTYNVLTRHAAGDYGDICAEDATLNDHAVHDGGRIMSSYYAPDGEKIWIITEVDRSCTTLLLPEEY